MLDEGAPFEDIRELVAGIRGPEVYESGDLDPSGWSAGMVQGLVQDVPSAREPVEPMVSGAEQITSGRRVGYIV
ncbi:hypothetical protein [Aeromicrobium sp. JJY06]|uniref:hypothetical protein n=1 Tax=Aeromicrobium sp. JJY06 TaxID=3373478 RepID=UPI00376EE842